MICPRACTPSSCAAASRLRASSHACGRPEGGAHAAYQSSLVWWLRGPTQAIWRLPPMPAHALHPAPAPSRPDLYSLLCHQTSACLLRTAQIPLQRSCTVAEPGESAAGPVGGTRRGLPRRRMVGSRLLRRYCSPISQVYRRVKSAWRRLIRSERRNEMTGGRSDARSRSTGRRCHGVTARRRRRLSPPRRRSSSSSPAAPPPGLAAPSAAAGTLPRHHTPWWHTGGEGGKEISEDCTAWRRRHIFRKFWDARQRTCPGGTQG